MGEKYWKRLNQLMLVLVCLLGVLLYQNIQKKQIENRVKVTQITESMSNQVEKVERKKVYLTFDDGPSKYTEEILKILKEEDVKATFFVIGREGEVFANRYRAIVDQGHTLAMHAYEHDYKKIYESLDAFAEDMKKLQNYLEKTTGVKSTIYRFPGGSSNKNMKVSVVELIQYLNEQGITYYDWNSLSEDAIDKKIPPEKLNQNILKDLKNQKTSIVLMHDLGDRHGTVEALKPLIKELKKMNCEILPITEKTQAIQHVKIEK